MSPARSLAHAILTTGRRRVFRPSTVLLQRQEAGITARRRGVDREGALDSEAVEVVRTAGLRPRPRQTFAAEGLHADDGADHVAVDVDVADTGAAHHRPDRLVDAAMDAEGEAVAGRRDLVEYLVELVAAPAHDMENGAEDLALEPIEPVDLEGPRREEAAMRGAGRHLALKDQLRLASHAHGVRRKHLAGIRVDDGTDIGGQQRRVADDELAHRAGEHGEDAVG